MPLDLPGNADVESLYAAAAVLARNGDYDFATRLLRRALEAVQLTQPAGRTDSVTIDAERAATEQRLLAAYAAYRLKLDERRAPLRDIIARTAVVTIGVSLTVILCVWFAMSRIDAMIASPVDKVVGVLQGAVQSDLPRVTDRVVETIPVVSASVDRSMQDMSLRLSDYLEKKVDRTLDDRIRAIVDERLKARGERNP